MNTTAKNTLETASLRTASWKVSTASSKSGLPREQNTTIHGVMAKANPNVKSGSRIYVMASSANLSFARFFSSFSSVLTFELTRRDQRSVSSALLKLGVKSTFDLS